MDRNGSQKNFLGKQKDRTMLGSRGGKKTRGLGDLKGTGGGESIKKKPKHDRRHQAARRISNKRPERENSREKGGPTQDVGPLKA